MSTERPKYDPANIEPLWQARWEEQRLFEARRHPGKPKAYILDMFPYPSGAGLHVGHPEGYTATDIVSRYLRMRGYDVLHPMGWDAFGLPAEQHALETGTHPAETTAKNVATFKRQLKSLGFSYDWSRELSTTDPEYVRWTQWLFLKLFERGLAYQAELPVNWCAALGTVLANEEVIDGKSERGSHPVVRLPLRQWTLRITAYADRLAQDLAGLDWPETREKQLHWIGRSEGAEVDFAIEGSADRLRIFTTRPDTLFGATYMVVAPEHPLLERFATAEKRAEILAYREESASRSELDRTALTKAKTGVFTGSYALHPLTGARLPIWVADFVLGSYGTGAIMGVPGHDARDFEFARAFGLPVVEVVSLDGALSETGTWTEAFVGEGVAVRSSFLDGLRTPEAKAAMLAHLEREGLGARRVQYRLRDWVFSRQRYWGEPIPIYFPVELAEGSTDPRVHPHTIRYDQPLPVPEDQLPVRLPELEDFKPSEDPAGPLARALDWRFFQRDGKWYARETNTMPQWAGSCWYYLRFIDPENTQAVFSQQAYDAWMPVDLYVGGSEHAVLHLLYARFWHKVLFDCGLVTHAEPFKKLVHQGMILGENNEKMSKSRGNVVNPDDIVRQFGADALRMYEMFMGPLEAVKPWQTNGVIGVRRFLDRVWNTLAFVAEDEGGAPAALTEDALRLLHKTVRKVGEDIEALRFNTAVSAMMILANALAELPRVPLDAARVFARILSPFAPHLAEELWHRWGASESISLQPWPEYDPALTVDELVEMAIQVNGKVRGKLRLKRDATEAEARDAVHQEPDLIPHLAGKTERRFVYVPGRIINIVVG
ncbi:MULTISPECIES: leucine--tRNA ligase [Myxococcus]|uniref:Leucine--tRNA ligase n=1 Tax=Myxococcus xanthus TaxID=34 RepID=A0AAE6G1J6_MYXXA|nr:MULTISPECIES: leucine--tRNA ligase [Myxococcus]QDE69062.1 leucine--tRNA ligase [Myxococcus xanthus]QDE76338.1 leucine--tRNA ligase [Myxococcus xanthus]WAM23039.1 leucine--tRNA ligase [Myxococcus sp. NMCA1]